MKDPRALSLLLLQEAAVHVINIYVAVIAVIWFGHTHLVGDEVKLRLR